MKNNSIPISERHYTIIPNENEYFCKITYDHVQCEINFKNQFPLASLYHEYYSL